MNSFKLLVFISSALILSSCRDKNPEAFAYGNFESEDIMVSAENSGKIILLNVNEGQSVGAGDLLAVLDTTQADLKRKQLKAGMKAVAARLTQLDAQLDVNRVNLDNLEKELARFGNLFLEKAATKKQMDDIQAQTELLKAGTISLEAQRPSIFAELESFRIQIAQLDDQISKSLIRAPRNGTVLEMYSREGELALPGKRILKLAELSVLNLRVFIDGNQLALVKPGDKVKVAFDGGQGLSYTEGTISWISQEAEFTPKIIQTRNDRVSLVYAMKVMVKNEGELKIGMPGEINLIENAGN